MPEVSMVEWPALIALWARRIEVVGARGVPRIELAISRFGFGSPEVTLYDTAFSKRIVLRVLLEGGRTRNLLGTPVAERLRIELGVGPSGSPEVTLHHATWPRHTIERTRARESATGSYWVNLWDALAQKPVKLDVRPSTLPQFPARSLRLGLCDVYENECMSVTVGVSLDGSPGLFLSDTTAWAKSHIWLSLSADGSLVLALQDLPRMLFQAP